MEGAKDTVPATLSRDARMVQMVRKRQPRIDSLTEPREAAPGSICERAFMSAFPKVTYTQVTEADLARARSDPAFRQKLLAQSLDTLLNGMKKLRAASQSPSASGGAKQLREGVELAVRLAELIQDAGGRPRGA